MTGSRLVIGSWNTTARSVPWRQRSSSGVQFRRSRPSSRMLPEQSAFPSGSRPQMDMAVTDLPEPDSPTKPMMARSATEKLMPFTAGALRK